MRRAVPLIAALRAHVDSQKDAELHHTLATLAHLAPADRDAVALLAHRLVNRMFHHLATRLKLAAALPDGDAYLAALAFLFDAAGTEYRTVTAPPPSWGTAASPASDA
jgi:glutamyl-tRNA reductase